jgi:hypothetical protein
MIRRHKWAAVLCIALGMTSSVYADGCRELKTLTLDQSDKDAYRPLLVRDRSGGTYTFEGTCAYLRGGRFRGWVDFLVANDTESGPAFLKVKSIRTFTVNTNPKIKVLRNDGWNRFNDTQRERFRLPVLIDRPINLSVADWNSAHNTTVAPTVNRKLTEEFHGYTSADPVLNSLEVPSFWKIPDGEILDKKTVTNYLIRFTASTGQTPIPLRVHTPYQVSQVELQIDSNLPSLQSSFVFLLVPD